MPWPSQISLSSGLPRSRAKPRALAVADEQLRDAAGSGKLEKRLRRVVAFQDLDVRAGGVGDRQPRVERGLILRRDIRLPDVCHDQFAVKPLCHDLQRSPSSPACLRGE